MAKRQGGAGFVTGFAGGIVLSAVSFVGSVFVIPPNPAPQVTIVEDIPVPPRLPSLTGQAQSTAPTQQQAAPARPQTGQPTQPVSAPAVDPSLSQGGAVALAPAPSIDFGQDSGAPVARSSSSGFVAPQSSGLGAPSTETASLSVGATAPARPRAGTGAPGGGGLSSAPTSAPTPNAPTATMPSMSPDGSLSRPRVSSIQPEVDPETSDSAPAAEIAAAPPPPGIPLGTPVTEPVAPEAAPRRIFSAAFSAADTQPLISIILVDSGPEMFPQETIDALSLPLTVAVPANARGAAERAQSFRRAGFEVLAMIPEDTAIAMKQMDVQGIEQTLAGIFENVPEVVGLLDSEGGAISSDSRVTRATLDYLALTGHVLVTQAGQGFNQSDRLAAAAGVPSGMVERRLNSSFGGAALVNGLQRVAVDARSSGGALLVGESDAATITSILTWAFSPGSRAVSLAPVTPLLERFEDAR